MRDVAVVAFLWLLAALVTTPNARTGSHPERCNLLRARVEREYLHGMRECREREVRGGVVDARCFARVRANFEAASMEASMHPWCRFEAATRGWELDPPAPRCSEAPFGFDGLCWP